MPVLACAAFARQATPPAFEVASVKVANPNPPSITLPSGTVRPALRGCRRPNPGTVNCTSATLKQILLQAYEIKTYQLEGPAWLDSDTYDVMAKVPEGVPVEKIPAMLQALLAERFKVVLHKETRSLPAYDLTTAKGGPKLKEVDPAEVAKAAQSAGGDGNATPPPPPPPPGAAGGSPRLGTMTVRLSSNGAREVRSKMTMTQLANMLSNNLSRPVVDMTDLKGTYNIELTYLANESDSLQSQLRAATPPAGMAGGDAAHQGVDANTPIATIFQALQQSLGLKLDAKKSPVEILIVESANKVPTEN